MRNPPRPWIGAAVAAGLVLRLWGIGFGLPMRYTHIDESIVTFYSLKLPLWGGDPRVFFDYPPLVLYFFSGLYLSLYAAGKVLGIWPSYSDMIASYLADASLFLRLARVFSAGAGAAGCWLAARIAQRIGGSPAVAAWAMALLPLAVREAHYATVDTITLLFFLAALRATLRASGSHSGGAWAWAGGWTGLCGAGKYYGLLLFPALLYLCLRPADISWGRKCRHAALAAGCGLLAFLITSPYILLNFPGFWERFIVVYGVVIAGGPSADFAEKFFRRILDMGRILGPAGWLLCLVSLRQRKALAVWLLAASLWAALLPWKAAMQRYLLPVAAAGCVLLACGFSLLRERFRRLTFGLLLLTLGFWLYRDIRLGIVLSRPDTRLQALEWIRENVPPGARILRSAWTPDFSPRDPYRVRVDWEGKIFSDPAAAGGYDLLVWSPSAFPEPPEFRRKRFRRIQRWEGERPGEFHNPVVEIWRRK